MIIYLVYGKLFVYSLNGGCVHVLVVSDIFQVVIVWYVFYLYI